MVAIIKPYPEYRDVDMPWIQRCPAHWSIQRMKYLVDERVQKGFPDEPLLTASQSHGVIPKSDYGTRTVEAQKDLHLLKLVEPGDYVISLRSFQGGIEYAHVRGIISPAYTVLKPAPMVRRGYYERFFKSTPFVQSMTLFVTGIREGQNIDYIRLSRAYLPVPPIEDQEAIDRYICHIDYRVNRLIKAKRRLIELLKEQKKAIINHGVTGGFADDVPLKPSGNDWLCDIPAHWELIPLKYLCRRIKNGATPPTVEQQFYLDGSVPWYGPSSLATKEQIGAPVRYLAKIAFEQGKARLITGPAILITVIGATAGRSGLLLEEGSTNQQITAFELMGGNIIPEFVLQQIRQAEYWLKFTASTATIPILDAGVVNRLTIALPPIGEAESILRTLSKRTEPVTATISRLESEIELIREYHTRLVADVVTGQIDVRGIDIPEFEEAENLMDAGEADLGVSDEETDIEQEEE